MKLQISRIFRPTRVVGLVATIVALLVTLSVRNGAAVSRGAAMVLTSAIGAIAVVMLIEVGQWWRRSPRGPLQIAILFVWTVIALFVLAVIATVMRRLLFSA